MLGTSLSIVTPTQGRPTLERMIASGVDQLLPGDEWCFVVDTDGMVHSALMAIADRVGLAVGHEDRGWRCNVAGHDAGCHDWGHSQVNYGIDRATGDWLVFQDDDDVFTPSALAAIRRTIAQLPSPRPLLFRFRAHWGRLIWAEVGDLREGRVGGHCLVTPNLPGKVGRFGSRYEGDHDMITSTLALWAAEGVAPEWCADIITIQRPS